MLAKSPIGAEGALAVHVLPGVNPGSPLMWLPTRTLIACPPHTQLTAWPNDPVPHVAVLGVMPFLL
jgi:hypothetical protein